MNQELYLHAHCTDEYGISPVFCKVTITPELAARLRLLRELAQANELRSVSCDSVAEWDERDDDIRLDGGEMVVTNASFWFEEYVKYQTGHIESCAVSFGELTQIIDDGKEIVFLDGGYEPDQDWVDRCVEIIAAEAL